MLAPHKPKSKRLPANREECPADCDGGANAAGLWCERCAGMGAVEVCEDCGAELVGSAYCPNTCNWCGDHECKIDSHWGDQQ